MSRNLIQRTEVKAVYGITALLAETTQVDRESTRSASGQGQKKKNQTAIEANLLFCTRTGQEALERPVTAFSCAGE